MGYAWDIRFISFAYYSKNDAIRINWKIIVAPVTVTFLMPSLYFAGLICVTFY